MRVLRLVYVFSYKSLLTFQDLYIMMKVKKRNDLSNEIM